AARFFGAVLIANPASGSAACSSARRGATRGAAGGGAAAGGGSTVDAFGLSRGISVSAWHLGQGSFLPAYFAPTLNFAWHDGQRPRISIANCSSFTCFPALWPPTCSPQVSSRPAALGPVGSAPRPLRYEI